MNRHIKPPATAGGGAEGKKSEEVVSQRILRHFPKKANNDFRPANTVNFTGFRKNPVKASTFRPRRV
jgi:hypothetical protein